MVVTLLPSTIQFPSALRYLVVPPPEAGVRPALVELKTGSATPVPVLDVIVEVDAV